MRSWDGTRGAVPDIAQTMRDYVDLQPDRASAWEQHLNADGLIPNSLDPNLISARSSIPLRLTSRIRHSARGALRATNGVPDFHRCALDEGRGRRKVANYHGEPALPFKAIAPREKRIYDSDGRGDTPGVTCLRHCFRARAAATHACKRDQARQSDTQSDAHGMILVGIWSGFTPRISRERVSIYRRVPSRR